MKKRFDSKLTQLFKFEPCIQTSFELVSFEVHWQYSILMVINANIVQ